MMQKILIILFFPTLLFAGDYNYESLPVQDAGRVKPLITVAQETLQLIHGKSKYEKKPALDIITTWMLVPEPWQNKPIIKIDHHGLKEALGFPKDKKYFSPEEVGSHQRLNILFSDLQVRNARKEKLNAYYQAVQRLQSQLLTFYGISQGGLRVFPPPKDSEESGWRSLRDMDSELSEEFFKIMASYSTLFVGVNEEAKTKAREDLKTAIASFTTKAKAFGGDKYPEPSEMQMEVHYQKLKPFLWTWILYLLSVLFFAISYLVAGRILTYLAGGTFLLAFIFHTYGFILRCIITQRPPVSNMYETVVWVGWGVVLFAGIFSFVKKKKYIALSGAVVATFCMMIADFSPVILDGSLQPLEPVLRSNLWLTIHVMTYYPQLRCFFSGIWRGRLWFISLCKR